MVLIPARPGAEDTTVSGGTLKISHANGLAFGGRVTTSTGATTITGGDGSRQPSENELEGARWQGRYIAETAKKLAA